MVAKVTESAVSNVKFTIRKADNSFVRDITGVATSSSRNEWSAVWNTGSAGDYKVYVSANDGAISGNTLNVKVN